MITAQYATNRFGTTYTYYRCTKKSAARCSQSYVREEQLATDSILRHRFPLAGATLGYSRRAEIAHSRLAEFDAIQMAAVERLIATRGDCINRLLTRQAQDGTTDPG